MTKKKIEGWESLHESQQSLYEYLLKGEDITLDNMREELGVNSINTVVHHLKQLEKKGYIRRNGDFGQIDVLSAPVRDIVYLNLYGMVACGPDGFFNEDNVVDRIPFPTKQLRVSSDSFLVEARGDSMEPLIHNKDLVLIDRSPVGSGDTAVVVHGDGAKLKRVFQKKDHVVLQSLNHKYAPELVASEDIRTVGVFRGVVRSAGNDNLKIRKNRPQ